MRIIGIDPGLRITGYGVIEVNPAGVKVLEAGTITPASQIPLEQRLQKIHGHLAGLLRSHHPDIMVLEKLYAHHRHPATAPLLGHVRGVICLCAAQEHVQLCEQSVKRVRKALLGNGNASKGQMQEFVKRLLKIKSPGFTLDASDALGLALGQARMMRLQVL